MNDNVTRGKSKISVIVLSVLIGMASLLILIIGFFYYELNCKVENVDASKSPDGKYEIELQSVGSPFLFGSASGRLTLKGDGKKIVYYDFEVSDDGAPIGESSWQVEWEKDFVQVTISGSEQPDEVIKLGYNGKVNSEKNYEPSTSYSEETIISEEEFEAYEEESRKEQTLEYLQIKDGYKAIYDVVFQEQEKTFIEAFDAKGDSRFILYEDDAVIEYLTYDRFSKNGECRLYVYYSCEKAEDGSWSAVEAEILDIYAYAPQNSDVISSGKNTWQDIGSEEYQDAAGEF